MTEDKVIPEIGGLASTHEWVFPDQGLASCTRCPTKATHNAVREGMVPACSPEVSCRLGWHEIVLDVPVSIPLSKGTASCMFCHTVYPATGSES